MMGTKYDAVLSPRELALLLQANVQEAFRISSRRSRAEEMSLVSPAVLSDVIPTLYV